jgi:hypothetical protein
LPDAGADLARNRALWTTVNAQVTDEDASRAWAAAPHVPLAGASVDLVVSEYGASNGACTGCSGRAAGWSSIPATVSGSVCWAPTGSSSKPSTSCMPPADAVTHRYYGIATAQWASRWPVEDLWAARLTR